MEIVWRWFFIVAIFVIVFSIPVIMTCRKSIERLKNKQKYYSKPNRIVIGEDEEEEE